MPRSIRNALLSVAVALLGSRGQAHAATRYVANDGVDGASCGTKAAPCRSITQAVTNASAGDSVIVGPGRYGDLDDDGTPGDRAGEETPAPLCSCMLAITKPVTVISSNGAASTIIDARSVNTSRNVLVGMNDHDFGKPGKGFTITNTASSTGAGLVVGSQNVRVRGNQVVATGVAAATFNGIGISLSNLSAGPMLVEGNQVIGWRTGILSRGTGKTVRKNQVSLSFLGIDAGGNGVVTGNVADDNAVGFAAQETAELTRNAVYGSRTEGFLVQAAISAGVDFTGTIAENDIVGNGAPPSNCGLFDNGNVAGVAAPMNYWGAPTGPSLDRPANDVCGIGPLPDATPFASKAYKVKAPIKP
jgi:hypothetical protein